ncbi:alpha/beta hydrolase [Marivivens marinus]|uniref:alpha/beta hydrolase n=1 Tax=Marivivens marinus TaxID=3110173 RepID=UPI003B8456A5
MTNTVPHLTRRAVLLGGVSLVAACAPRGQITVLPALDTADKVDVLVATNRAPVETRALFSGNRSTVTHYAEITVSVPPRHRTGEVEIHRRRADARKHFGITGAERLSDARAFGARVARRALDLPAGQREAVVYVHGFNTNFPEALYRLGQMVHDFGVEGVPVLFSWPSGGEAGDYLYDRDSVLFARDSLEELLTQLDQSQVNRITLIGHSMGSQLIMETLRQRAIRRQGLWSKLTGVILVAPDIDVDLFTRQALEIGTLPQPFIVMTSDKDRALQLSEWVSSSRARLGTVTSSAAVAALPVTVIDTSSEADRFGGNHSTGLSSPAMIALIRGLRENEITESPLPGGGGGVALPAILSGNNPN